MRILCIGDLCGDLIIPYGETRTNIEKIRTGEVKSASVEFRHGGTAGNTASVLGRMNDHPYFITDLCSDRIGTFLKDEMIRRGVDMSLSVTGPRSAQICIAVLDRDGERTMFSWLPPGSDYPTFSKESFRESVYEEPCLVFVGGMTMNNDPVSMDAVCTFAERMKQNGSVFVFDLNVRAEHYGMNAERKKAYDRMISAADIVLGSGAEEFAPVTGISDLHDAAKSIAEKGHIVIARNGSLPVTIFDGDSEETVEVKPVKVICSVGAGDVFNGAFLHAYHEGRPLKECVEFANDTAGYMISHEGHLELPEEALR